MSVGLLWAGDHTSKVRWTFTVIVFASALGFTVAARERVMRPLQTLPNLLAALREDDFSIRGRHHRSDDARGGHGRGQRARRHAARAAAGGQLDDLTAA